MEKKLQDAELKVMNVIWREQPVKASKIVKILAGETGWNMNTTYTLIKRCIEKGAVERSEPGFVCRALVTKPARCPGGRKQRRTSRWNMNIFICGALTRRSNSRLRWL